jgi:hypothetical protein
LPFISLSRYMIQLVRFAALHTFYFFGFFLLTVFFSIPSSYICIVGDWSLLFFSICFPWNWSSCTT